MNALSGKEVLSIMRINEERDCFRRWGRPIDLYGAFLKIVWKKTIWAQMYSVGYIDGAISLNYLTNIEKENSAEYQCLLHHFCIERELEHVD